MKIKAKNPKISSMKLCVPVDGIITIDGDGVADVSVKCATILVKGTSDWDYLKKGTAATAEEDTSDEDTSSEEDASDEDDSSKMTEREEFEEGLKKMNLEAMKSMAQEAEYPEEEWKKIGSKKLMSAYLLKKFDEANEEEE